MSPMREIRLNALHMCTPSQVSAGFWAHPQDQGRAYNTLGYWQELAQVAERGLLDAVFLADPIGVSDIYQGSHDAVLKAGSTAPVNDPTLVVPVMAAVTSNLGFAVTGNVSFDHPYLLARRFSTLDHLTEGRIAINVVTGASPSGAKAMGQTLRPHDERYDLADDYMAALHKLWEVSWQDDAVEADPVSRVYVRPGSVQRVAHESPIFKLDGVHLCEPSRQRTPVLYQAGASGRGRDFAARHAEAVFMVGHEKQQVAATVRDIRSRAARMGRDPALIHLMLGVTIIVGANESEAKDRQRELQSYLDVEGALAIYSTLIGQDLSRYSPDQPLVDLEGGALKTIAELIKGATGRPPTLRDLVRFDAAPGKEAFIVGSPSQVAQELISWVEEAGVDGFNISRTAEHAGLASIVDLVVPELQSRGVYKRAYAQGSLRNKLFGAGDRLHASYPAVRNRHGE